LQCKDSQTLMQGYMDGELDLVRTLEIEGHMRDCRVCSLDFEQQQALRSALKAEALYHKAPSSLQRKIRSSVRQANRAESKSSPAWRWVSVAALFVLVASISISVIRLFPGRQNDEIAQEVVASHFRSLQLEGVKLVDVLSKDTHTVKPWFDGKIDFAPQVEKLEDQGFPLYGGRLDYLDNRPVAALVYTRQKHYINLFIWPMQGEPSQGNKDSGAKPVSLRGINLVHWTRFGMNYWAASDLNNDELQEFARLLQ
jgi:anti-sigma factor RsiW